MFCPKNGCGNFRSPSKKKPLMGQAFKMQIIFSCEWFKIRIRTLLQIYLIRLQVEINWLQWKAFLRIIYRECNEKENTKILGHFMPLQVINVGQSAPYKSPKLQPITGQNLNSRSYEPISDAYSDAESSIEQTLWKSSLLAWNFMTHSSPAQFFILILLPIVRSIFTDGN